MNTSHCKFFDWFLGATLLVLSTFSLISASVILPFLKFSSEDELRNFTENPQERESSYQFPKTFMIRKKCLSEVLQWSDRTIFNIYRQFSRTLTLSEWKSQNFSNQRRNCQKKMWPFLILPTVRWSSSSQVSNLVFFLINHPVIDACDLDKITKVLFFPSTELFQKWTSLKFISL